MSSLERQRRHVIDRVNNGYITVEDGLERVLATGDVLAIGTAETQSGHVPGIAMTFDLAAQRWRPRISNERGGTIPVLRAGVVARTAIAAAFVGNVNVAGQRDRLNRRILPDHLEYDRGTLHWEYNPETREFDTGVHAHLEEAASAFPEDLRVGAIDFIERDDSFQGVSREPGHFFSPSREGYETKASMPVRGHDIHRLLGKLSRYEGHNYEPFPRGEFRAV